MSLTSALLSAVNGGLQGRELKRKRVQEDEDRTQRRSALELQQAGALLELLNQEGITSTDGDDAAPPSRGQRILQTGDGDGRRTIHFDPTQSKNARQARERGERDTAVNGFFGGLRTKHPDLVPESNYSRLPDGAVNHVLGAIEENTDHRNSQERDRTQHGLQVDRDRRQHGYQTDRDRRQHGYQRSEIELRGSIDRTNDDRRQEREDRRATSSRGFSFEDALKFVGEEGEIRNDEGYVTGNRRTAQEQYDAAQRLVQSGRIDGQAPPAAQPRASAPAGQGGRDTEYRGDTTTVSGQRYRWNGSAYRKDGEESTPAARSSGRPAQRAAAPERAGSGGGAFPRAEVDSARSMVQRRYPNDPGKQRDALTRIYGAAGAQQILGAR